MNTIKLRQLITVRGYRTLISTKTLAESLNSKSAEDIVVLDCAFSAAPEDAYTGKYLKGHIPGAKFYDHHTCVTSTSLIPRNIPDPYCFTKKLQQFGVSSNTEVVVYDRNDMASFAARVWWLLRLFGHDKVSILDGGLKKWIFEGNDVHSCTSMETQKNASGDFKVNLQLDLIYDRSDVKRNLQEKSTQLLDARERQYFSGAMPHSEIYDDVIYKKNMSPPFHYQYIEPYLIISELRSLERALPGGHIPGAKNIPSECFYNDDSTFKSVEEIKEVFYNWGIDLSKPMVSMCRTGVDACSVASAAHLLGKDIPVYFGSWMEWAQTQPDMITQDLDRTQG